MLQEQKETNQRLGKVEKNLESMGKKLGNVEGQLESLESTTREGFTELNKKYDESIDLLRQIAHNTRRD